LTLWQISISNRMQIKTLLLSFYCINSVTPIRTRGFGPLAKGGKTKAVSKLSNVAVLRNNTNPDSPTYVSDYIDDKIPHPPASLEALDVDSQDYLAAQKESRKSRNVTGTIRDKTIESRERDKELRY
jgi:hypothetical protein